MSARSDRALPARRCKGRAGQIRHEFRRWRPKDPDIGVVVLGTLTATQIIALGSDLRSPCSSCLANVLPFSGERRTVGLIVPRPRGGAGAARAFAATLPSRGRHRRSAAATAGSAVFHRRKVLRDDSAGPFTAEHTVDDLIHKPIVEPLGVPKNAFLPKTQCQRNCSTRKICGRTSKFNAIQH